MASKKIENWKKVLESDLDYIVGEVKNMAQVPAVIILSGPVGAGKTTFTKKFIQALSIGAEGEGGPITGKRKIAADSVQSPTYSIVNEVGNTVHADLYRIEGKDELVHLELQLHLEGKEFFLVEWGRPYLIELQRQMGQEFKFYEVDIQINEGHFVDGRPDPSRNITFFQLD